MYSLLALVFFLDLLSIDGLGVLGPIGGAFCVGGHFGRIGACAWTSALAGLWGYLGGSWVSDGVFCFGSGLGLGFGFGEGVERGSFGLHCVL